MIPRLLSVAGPQWVYTSLAFLVYGLWNERRKFDWLALVPAFAGLAASVVFLSPVHRLFFDEDIYINIANNLTHAPVNQVTVLGGPADIQVSSYYKEPAGWPVLLSLAFLVMGRSEEVAFWTARILFAISIAAVYQFARQALGTRTQALLAAILFGATPVCFWFSASPGTDIPAVLMATLGMWGLFTGNGALAAAGLALGAQFRMELLILVPLIWLAPRISVKWKLAAVSLLAIEIVHVAWVMSVAPVLAQAERVPAAFSLRYVVGNLRANIAYFLDPYRFSGIVMLIAAAFVFYKAWRAPRAFSWSGFTEPNGLLFLYGLALFCVYLGFYAGSFEWNPRYSIQLLPSLAMLAASLMKGPRALLILSVVLPYTGAHKFPGYVQALAEDHRISAEFALRISPADLVVSAQAEMFLNHNRAAMNAAFASGRKELLEAEIGKRKVWYHSGVRTNSPDTEEALADRWVKSNFELHLIESREAGGLRIAFYEMLLKHVHREAGLSGPFEGKSNRGKRG